MPLLILLAMLAVFLIAMLAVFLVLTFVIFRVDGLTLFAPKSSKRIASTARTFCVERCRTVDGQCPLEDLGTQSEDCPLWKFVDADLPTNAYGDPFAHLKTS